MILGRAGSGKTELLLERVCRRAAQSPLASAQHPPLLVVVPEQQALMTEQALLAKLGELLGLPAATSRIRVMSLSRLGNWLASEAGQLVRRDGDLGRRRGYLWRAFRHRPKQFVRRWLDGGFRSGKETSRHGG